MKSKELSQAENQIMELIWTQNQEYISIPEILENLPQKKWKYTTVATFVSRLAGKGFLNARKTGGVNLYSPRLSKEDYLNMRTQDFIALVHNNSPKSLMATLYSDKLSHEDYCELMEMLKKYEED